MSQYMINRPGRIHYFKEYGGLDDDTIRDICQDKLDDFSKYEDINKVCNCIGEITIDIVKEALKDLLSVQNRQISIENIQKTVADFFHIKMADMTSKRRPANIARPRQIAMYLAKELTQKSLPEIGELFGGRDHTTVLHAVRKIAQDRAKNPECNHELHVLEQTLKG